MAGKTFITKQFSFCYGHYLPDYTGKCKNIHGHNVTLSVTLNKNVKPKYKYHEMIMDFNELSSIVKEEIIEVLDHKFLNEDFTFFKEKVPLAENIMDFITDRLLHFFGDGLEKVVLTETPTSWITWVRDA